jgi:hypothetical protein
MLCPGHTATELPKLHCKEDRKWGSISDHLFHGGWESRDHKSKWTIPKLNLSAKLTLN